MIAVKTTACCLSGLSFCEGKACSGSQFLQLLVQQVLLVLCCFACRAEHQHLKLTCFATPRGPLTVSFTMALVCCTACKLSTCLQLCFSMKALLRSAAPQARCNGFPWRTSQLQQAVSTVLLCSVARIRLTSCVNASDVGMCRFRFCTKTFVPSCRAKDQAGQTQHARKLKLRCCLGGQLCTCVRACLDWFDLKRSSKCAVAGAANHTGCSDHLNFVL